MTCEQPKQDAYCPRQ